VPNLEVSVVDQYFRKDEVFRHDQPLVVFVDESLLLYFIEEFDAFDVDPDEGDGPSVFA
jgi:hypothetical protein